MTPQIPSNFNDTARQEIPSLQAIQKNSIEINAPNCQGSYRLIGV